MASSFSETVQALIRAAILSMLVVVCCGCPTANDATVTEPESVAGDTTPAATGPLRVTVLDDTPLAAILAREWNARSEQQIEIIETSVDDLLTKLQAGLDRLDTDVVIYPSALLGELAERKLLRTMPRELADEPDFAFTEIFGLIRRRETQWNSQPYAVPLGTPPLVLLRRTDLVPDAPSTWTELSAEVDRLRASTTNGLVPLAQPLADGWAAKMLQARSAAYMFDRSRVSSVFDYSTMTPRIAEPPFVRALEELAADNVGASTDLAPGDVLKQFLEGRCAMAITWPAALLEELDPPEFPMAVSELPGTTDQFLFATDEWKSTSDGELIRVSLIGTDGRLGSVSLAAKNPSLGNIFLAWAAGREQSRKLSPRSQHTAPFRASHAGNAADWVQPQIPAEVATEYVAVVESALSRSEAYQAPRLPGQHLYMQKLDAAVHLVLAGAEPAKTALEKVAADWEQITDSLDRVKQKAAYRKSLGIKVR